MGLEKSRLQRRRTSRKLLPTLRRKRSPERDKKVIETENMEEEKAVAYYDELTRRGEGAARFKQGLGFSSGDSVSRGSAIAFSSDSSSFLNTFVKASSPTKAAKYEKEAQLQSIQNKLSKKKNKDDEDDREKSSRVYRERDHRRRSMSRERDRGREYRRRSRSRSRERYRDKRRERRSRSGSPRPERRSERRRSRSRSPRESRRSEKGKERNGGADYSKLIQGYDKMTPAERVKARMKLQLKETTGKDKTKGMGSGWERFEFDKDAPLDDEEMEAAEDDVALVKHIGQSFRFSALEVRREEQIKAAHDEAMFGAPALLTPVSPADEPKVDNEKEHNESEFTTSLLSEKVLAKQQGSWRDRVRKL